MPVPVRSLRLIKTQAQKLDNLTGEGGELFYDHTNQTLRIFDGKNTVGSILATRAYVNSLVPSTIPSSLLDLGITDGTVGQILTTDGNGNFTFTDAGATVISASISNISQASPAVVTTSDAHGISEGQAITITDVEGMVELNGNEYYADVISSTTLALYTDLGLATPVDSSIFTAYTSGGLITAELSSGEGGSVFDQDLNTTDSVTFAGITLNSVEVTAFSTDDTLVGDSDTTVPTESAVKGYVDSSITDFLTADDLASYGYVESGTLANYVTTTSLTTALNSYVTATTFNTTTQNKTNWDTAYSWGDHAQAGYITSVTETDTLDIVTTRGNTTTNSITTGNIVSNGSVSADEFVSTGSGAPTITSASTITLDAPDGVTIGDFIQLPVLTTAIASPQSGMIAMADGIGWDPGGTGTEQLVAYVEGNWRVLFSL